MGSNILESLFAQIQKRDLIQQIVSGRTAYGLFWKDDQLNGLFFCRLDTRNNFLFVVFEIADSVIQLGKSYFHYQ